MYIQAHGMWTVHVHVHVHVCTRMCVNNNLLFMVDAHCLHARASCAFVQLMHVQYTVCVCVCVCACTCLCTHCIYLFYVER